LHAGTAPSPQRPARAKRLLPLRQHLTARSTPQYEKRVREFSTLEKIFEYFSTAQEKDGTPAMDARDLVRSIVPTYPPHNSQMERGGFLDGAPGPLAGPCSRSLPAPCTCQL
jgi:hypothetical protein